jgi:probable F420-dependent oxidoreductase
MTDEVPLLGFGLPVAGAWASPDAMVRVARLAEDLGWASLWTFQRLLYPEGPDATRLDPPHRSVHDAVVPLAYVAGLTRRIRLGTATVCAPFVPPMVLAKTMASLDVLSGGRLSVGVGMGWLPEEHVAAGVPMQRRGARFEEYLRCLHALWTEDPVRFAGEFYEVPLAHVAPRPVQRPHPPVLVGGSAEAALRRAGRLADGWIGSSRHEESTIAASVATVRQAAEEAGRDPDALHVLLRGVPDLVQRDPGAVRRRLHGTAEQVTADLVDLRAQGVTEVLLDLNLSPRGGGQDDPGAALSHAEEVLAALAPGPVGPVAGDDARRPRPSA